MKHLTKLLLTAIFLVAGVSGIHGQDNDRGFEVPSKYVSLLFVPDANCPLQMSGPAKAIGYSNNGFYFGYTLQNVSHANIESYTIEELDWFGARGYGHPAVVKKDKVFAPFLTDYTLPDKILNDLLPFDEKLAKQYGISDISNKFWIAMVVKVKLSDGTVYDASQKFERLRKFVIELELSSEMPANQLEDKEKHLRDFVSKLTASDK